MAIRAMGPRRIMSRRAILGAMGAAALALAGCKGKSAEQWHVEGVALARQGKLIEAHKCYDEAIKLKPDYAEVRYDKGVAYGKQGKLDQAIKCYEQAIGIKPGYSDAWYNKGQAHYQKKELDKAVECLKKVLEFEPNNADAQKMMCALLLKTEDVVGFLKTCIHDPAVRRGNIKGDKEKDDAIFELMRQLEEGRRRHHEIYQKMKDAGAIF
jgi:tetratricopeptide (TPR) repeat protein